MIDDRGENEGSPPESANLWHDESLEGSLLRFDDQKTDDQQADSKQTREQRIHLLEIELRRIRKEASAARLDARAAEIELMIRRLSQSGSDPAGLQVTPEHTASFNQQLLETPRRQVAGFQSWDEVREAQQRFRDTADHSQSRLRFDGPAKPHHHLSRPPNPKLFAGEIGADEPTSGIEDASAENVTATDAPVSDPPIDIQADADADAETSTDERSFAQQLDAVFHDERPEQVGVSAIAEELELDEELDADRSVKKSRPMAMIISAVLHAVVLLLLAGWTLSSHKPKDQVSITASATAASSEESMETFTLDASEPEVEPTEPTESETEYELSPIGEIAVSEFSADIAPAPPSPSAASMMSSAASSSAAAAMSLNAFSEAKIQFCGVEGGGNHFVYLVDSSGSMGDSFDSARKELLNSIDFLKPDQRFYVIFFDADPDFMRLADSSVDEPRSVEATPENKLALKRWAMQIGQDRGKNPYEVLEFALTLRPDVIFLLSDGEFPQRIEDLLQEKNRIENLFGDNGPMCIVHTIAYYSKEGEVRMRRIAEKNGGQYRYVPRP